MLKTEKEAAVVGIGMWVLWMLLLGVVGWAQTPPPTFPAGQTTFVLDLTSPGGAQEFQLELDGQEQGGVPVGSFSSGEFPFPSVLITPGLHTVRTRACRIDNTIRVCSGWSAGLTYQAQAGLPLSVPPPLRIKEVVIVVGS